MKLSSKELGNYRVYRHKGSSDYLDKLNALWKSKNPKGITEQSLQWVLSCYLCHGLLDNEQESYYIMASTIMKELVYGWEKEIEKNNWLCLKECCEDYLGIESGTPFEKIEKQFNQEIWTELKEYIKGVSKLSPNDIEDVGCWDEVA